MKIIKEKMLCNKCKKETIKENKFEIHEKIISIMIGTVYPKSGNVEIYSLDLCKKCTKDFLKLLRENNYSINTEEKDV